MPAATIAFGVVCQMGVSTALRAALGTVFTPLGLVLLVGATLLGVLMGALPGLGGPVALSLLIPLTFDSEPASAFMIMAAALGGVNFGGSVTAILFNTPGTAPNAATLFDGHPLAEQGRANEAIAASAVASAAGAVLGFVLVFGPAAGAYPAGARLLVAGVLLARGHRSRDHRRRIDRIGTRRPDGGSTRRGVYLSWLEPDHGRRPVHRQHPIPRKRVFPSCRPSLGCSPSPRWPVCSHAKGPS
jgi:hypothetical protein